MKFSLRKNRPAVYTTFLMVAASHLMGATSCQEEPKVRELKRRVQLGKISAPAVPLQTGTGAFDFQYAANAQMWTVLAKTGAFTTATIDPNKLYDPAGLTQDLADSFNQCQEPDALETPVMAKVGGIMKKTTLGQKAACMIDVPNGVIQGQISNFALYQGAEVKFDIASGLINMAQFSFDRYVMTANMQAFGAVKVNDKIAATTTNQYQNNLKVGLGLNLGVTGLNLSTYFNSNLSSVVEDGLINSVNDLKKQWDADKGRAWYAMVIRNCDRYVYISGGGASDVNLQEGDILRLSNVDYYWEGQSCSSRLVGTTESLTPVSYAKVIRVGDTISVAQVIDNDPNYPRDPAGILYPGARAYLQKLYVPPAKTAATAAK